MLTPSIHKDVGLGTAYLHPFFDLIAGSPGSARLRPEGILRRRRWSGPRRSLPTCPCSHIAPWAPERDPRAAPRDRVASGAPGARGGPRADVELIEGASVAAAKPMGLRAARDRPSCCYHAGGCSNCSIDALVNCCILVGDFGVGGRGGGTAARARARNQGQSPLIRPTRETAVPRAEPDPHARDQMVPWTLAVGAPDVLGSLCLELNAIVRSRRTPSRNSSAPKARARMPRSGAAATPRPRPRCDARRRGPDGPDTVRTAARRDSRRHRD